MARRKGNDDNGTQKDDKTKKPPKHPVPQTSPPKTNPLKKVPIPQLPVRRTVAQAIFDVTKGTNFITVTNMGRRLKYNFAAKTIRVSFLKKGFAASRIGHNVPISQELSEQLLSLPDGSTLEAKVCGRSYMVLVRKSGHVMTFTDRD